MSRSSPQVKKKGLFLYGDLIIDQANEIEWIALKETIDRSYSDIKTSLQADDDPLFGFRYATQSELISIWSQAEIPTVSLEEAPDDKMRERYSTMIRYLGLTNEYGDGKVAEGDIRVWRRPSCPLGCKHRPLPKCRWFTHRR